MHAYLQEDKCNGQSSTPLVCILLVAGHSNRLENEIKSDPSQQFRHLTGIPKALLPCYDNVPALTLWWRVINKRQQFTDVYIVTNADKYKYYERWATANGFPRENIINDGAASPQATPGAVADIDLAIRSRNINGDVMVIAGDMLFRENEFNISSVIRFFQRKRGELAIYFEIPENEHFSKYGLAVVDPKTNLITHFKEKPSNRISNFAVPVFYCFRQETFTTIREWLAKNHKPSSRSCGQLIEHLVAHPSIPVYGMKLSSQFQLIGNVGLREYTDCLGHKKIYHGYKKPIMCRAYARVGLMGNPSDGFGGKTIALSIANYWAEATIQESEKLELIPHPLNDPTVYGGLEDLYMICSREGYLGGLRLMQATCKMFVEYCLQHGVNYHKRNFRLSYDTNIPRQVGLSGSSAIVTSTLKCLMSFFGLTVRDFPLPAQPSFVLSVETELGIQAGLQDRVVQIYEGMVYMDLDLSLLKNQGHGNYKRIQNEHIEKLEGLFLAYLSEPSDSGKAHHNVNQRWLAGDTEVIEGMKEFANLTDQAKKAIESGNITQLMELMNNNFNLRKKIYGKAALGRKNLMMIRIARSHGAACKFPGSGGAIVGMCPNKETRKKMREDLEINGCVVVDIIPNAPSIAQSAL